MGIIPVEGKRVENNRDALFALYPRDLVREMVKVFMDSLPPPEDAVILPGRTAEEFEVELVQLLDVAEDASPEELAEIEKMKQNLRDIRGKKVSELPPLTPEEEAADIEEEVETAIANVLSSWINALYFAWTQRGKPSSLPLTETLEPVIPIVFGTSSNMTWQEAPCNSIALTSEQVGKLHEAFAANLRPIIDVAPEGYVVIIPSNSNELFIRKDMEGYCLCARSVAL